MGGMVVFSKNYLKIFFFTEGTQLLHQWWLPVGILLRHSFHLGIYSTCPQSQKVSISISILWAGLATFQRESWDSDTSAILFFFFNCLMAALGLHSCSWTFSIAARGSCCCCGVRASPWGGFSCCGAWAQQLWHMGLVAPRHVESSPMRDRTCGPCIGRRLLSTVPAGKSRRGLSWTWWGDLCVFCVFSQIHLGLISQRHSSWEKHITGMILRLNFWNKICFLKKGGKGASWSHGLVPGKEEKQLQVCLVLRHPWLAE